MELSAVSGVLDSYGGLRVVVTQLWRLRHHVRIDEMCFTVPDFWVEEPVPWNAIPYTVKRVEDHIVEWIRTRNDPDDIKQLPITLYRLRCLEDAHSKGSLDLESIVET